MFKGRLILALLLLAHSAASAAGRREPAVPAFMAEAGRAGAEIIDEMVRERQRRIREIQNRRVNLLADQARLRREVAAHPADAWRQQELDRINVQVDQIVADERRAEQQADRMEELGAGIFRDVAGEMIADHAADRERKKAVVVAVAQQEEANAGKMQQLEKMLEPENVRRMALAAASVGGALITIYFAAKFGLYYMQRFVGMPKLVRESSEKNLWQQFVSLFSSEEEAGMFLNDIILSPDLAALIADLAKALTETKQDGIPFRNVLLYGEPGTGKTMIAKRVAKFCGMDFAILSGADFTQFEEGKDIEQLHLLFDRAEQSEKGMIIFVDEADAALRDRKDMNNRGKALVDAFLARTGTKSDKFTIWLATNHPKELDPAVLSRISKKVHVALPDVNERAKIMQLYLTKYFIDQATILNGEQAVVAAQLDEAELRSIAKDLTGWSGRDLEDLIGELRYVLSQQHTRVVTSDIVKIAVKEKLSQRKELQSYDGHSAAAAAAAA